MTSFYNENDKNCVDVLKRRIDNGSLPSGYIDSRSIEEIRPNDIKQYNEVHFFAGIGGFALGFARAGIPNDTTVWTGGFPCQDLSVAGKRAGLAGKRSGLYFEFHRLITANYPKWVVLENVPGLLSSNEGKDFAIVIGGLTGIIPNIPQEGWGNAGFARGPVYNIAYRVLDAQFFGVPQRRRRVFIVGSLGSGRAAEVLFEREGVRGDTPPSREAGKDFAPIAGTLVANGGGLDRPAGNANELDFCIPDVANTLSGHNHRYNPTDGETFAVSGIGEYKDGIGTLGANGGDLGGGSEILYAFMPRKTQMDVYDDLSPTMHAGGGGMGAPAIAWNGIQITSKTNRSLPTVELAPTLDQGGQMMTGVRRLTPTECERLQGFTGVEEKIIIDVCLDHQNNSASVEILSPKLPKPAGNVGRKELLETARFAESNSSQGNQPTSGHAPASVLINCGERKAEIHSQGKSCLSVNFAEDKNSFHPLMQNEDFAPLLAGVSSILGQITKRGAEGLPQSAQSLIAQRDGQNVVRLSGSEIMQLVKGAGNDLTTNKKLLKSIISDPLSMKISDMTMTTLFYFVLAVISGYIPSETLKSNSFQIEINTIFGWTFGQADTPRYRQLGNAVAVPCAEWIGRRIMDTLT